MISCKILVFEFMTRLTDRGIIVQARKKVGDRVAEIFVPWSFVNQGFRVSDAL